MTARLGEVAGVGDVELEDLTAAWIADEWAGYWLVPNWNTTRIFRIAGNSAQKLIIVKDTNGEGLLSVTSRRSLYAILTDSDARRYVALTKDGEDYTPIDTRLLYYFEGAVKHVQYGWVGSGASALIPPAAPNRFLDRNAYDSVLIPDHVSYMTGSTFYVLVSGDTMSTVDFAFSRDKFVKDAVAVTDAVTPLIITNYYRIVVAGDTVAITENIPPMVTVPYIWWAAGNGDLMRLTTTRSAYSSITMKDANTPAPTGISNNVWEMVWGDAFCYSAKDRLFYGIGGGLQVNNIKSISAWDPALRAMRPGELVAPGYPAAAFTPSAGQLQADAAGNLWHVSGNTGNPTQHFLAKNVPGNIDTVSTSTYPHPSISGRFWDPRALLYDAVLDRLFFIATIFSGVNFIFRIDPANPSAIEGQRSTTADFQGDLVMRRPNASPSTSEIITVDGNTTVQRMTATGIMTLQATATLAGASLYSVTYDPTRDEIWAGSQFEGKVYRLNGSTLAVLSSITLASSRRPAKLIYEPASSGPYGVSGDRVWVIPEFSVTNGEALSIDPANPTVIESIVNPATSPVSTQGGVVTAMRPVYTSPRLGLPAVASPTNAGASLLRPEAWPLPGAVTNQGSIIAGHWRAGSHNDIDAATNRVNRIRDLSGNGKHFTPKDGLNAKRCLHVANEATANNPCFSFAKDAHMVAEGGWTMADLIYNSAIANPFDKDEFLWFIVYRRHATPVGFEVLFGAFTTTAQELGIVNRSGSGNDAWLGFYNGANANVTSTRAQVGGTIGGRVLGGWMGANFVTNPPIYGSVDQATDNSNVTTTGALPLTGVPEIGNTTNGSFTALDADIYEIFCLRRANTVRFLGPKFFTHYARAKYGMT